MQQMTLTWVAFFKQVEHNKATRLAAEAQREAEAADLQNNWYYMRDGLRVTNCLKRIDQTAIKHGHSGPCNCHSPQAFMPK